MNTAPFKEEDGNLIFNYFKTNPLARYLEEPGIQLNNRYVNKGAHGELTARLLRISFF